MEILDAVAPINYEQERSTFFDLHYCKNPQYKYRIHDLDPFALKRKLFNLPLEQIKDEDLHSLYDGVMLDSSNKCNFLPGVNFKGCSSS